MFYGNPRLVGLQLAAAAITAVYSMTVTAAILWVLSRTIGIRVSAVKEKFGLDETLHKQVGPGHTILFVSALNMQLGSSYLTYSMCQFLK